MTCFVITAPFLGTPTQLSLGARKQLCFLIGPNTEVRHSPRGRPMSSDGRFVSISHTQGYVAAACSTEGKIGVDLSGPEDVPHLEPAAPIFLSEEEQRVVFLLPQHLRLEHLQKLWVLKEALLKGVGIGLGLDPSNLSFTCEGKEWRCHIAPRWRFDIREIAPGFVCGVAIKSRHAKVEWGTIVNFVR